MLNNQMVVSLRDRISSLESVQVATRFDERIRVVSHSREVAQLKIENEELKQQNEALKEQEKNLQKEKKSLEMALHSFTCPVKSKKKNPIPEAGISFSYATKCGLTKRQPWIDSAPRPPPKTEAERRKEEEEE